MREEKIELQKKVHRRVCVRNITFLAARSASQVIFCGFFRLIRFYAEKKLLLQKMVGDWCPPADPVSTALL